jgi:hypothetical protein
MMVLEQTDLDRELRRILATSMPGGKPSPEEDEAEEPDEVPEEE